MNARVKPEVLAPTIAGIPTTDLVALFDHCNQRYFNDELVPSAGFRLVFSRSVRLSGCFSYCLSTHQDWSISISQRLQQHPRALRSTLVHEMVHMLAHQRFRATGDSALLDTSAVAGQPFVNKGHGAFFLGYIEHLNQQFPELSLTVHSTFGDHLYEHSNIPPARLLLVHIGDSQAKGMIYRLHPQAVTDRDLLQQTAEQIHGPGSIRLLEVAGHLAEGFPSLRRDNAPRKNMRRLSLRQFSLKAEKLLKSPGTRECLPGHVWVTHNPSESHIPSSASRPACRPHNRPVAHKHESYEGQT